MHPDRPHTREESLALLDWYRAAGVDLAIGETPVDRFALSTATMPRLLMPAAPASVTPHTAGSEQTGGPPAQAAALAAGSEMDPAEAMALAATANDLETLRATLDAFDGCGLKLRATQLVFADGNPEAGVMLVGEAPGRDEDLQGKPFVGRSGQLLDRMLAAIGLNRTNVYIANTVPWRPPGNRTPSPAEIATCMPFLVRQVELVAPKLLVTLGAAATTTVFGRPMSILKMRGKWEDLTIGKHNVRAMPTLHPAYLLRQPGQKHLSWRDMPSLKQAMVNSGIG
jgi:DNA polymerase